MGPKGVVEGNISQANKLKYCLMEKQSKYIPFVLIMLILAGLFYWYEWRPSTIRKNCYKEAKLAKQTKCSDPSPNTLCWFSEIAYYKECLIRNGIKPSEHDRW